MSTNNLSVNKNTMVDNIIYFTSSFLLLLAYSSESSNFSIVIYAVLFLLTFKYKMIPFLIIGCGNCLPALQGVSPVFIGVLFLIILLFTHAVLNKELRFDRIQFPWSILIFMWSWSLLTGFFYEDISFIVKLTSIILFSITIFLCQKNLNLDANEMFDYYLYGMLIANFIALLIQLNFPGFTSNHSFRLAIGERSDPNSTGLLFAIMSVYFYIKIQDVNYVSLFKRAVDFSLLALSIFNLVSTQSRGSFFSFVIVVICCILTTKKTIEIKTLKNILKIIVLFIFTLVLITSYFQGTIIELWNNFSNRLIISEAGDGERLYLLEMSIKAFLNSPLLGESLESFEIRAGHVPHNSFSDYMVTNGIIGILFYLLFFIKPLITYYEKKNLNYLKKQYYCYMVCIINIFFYSASNEKIPFFLLLLLVLSADNMEQKPYTDLYEQ